MSGRSIALSDGGEPERFEGAAITWDLFPTLGVPPGARPPLQRGRRSPGAEPVVILSDESGSAATTAIRHHRPQRHVNGSPHTVVGVMPPNSAFPKTRRSGFRSAPLADKRAADRARPVHVRPPEARRRPGAGARGSGGDGRDPRRRSIPTTNEGWSAIARPLTDEFIPDDVRLVLLTMMGAVTLVLLIACANVANLMLARASGRQREFSRARRARRRPRALVRQLLTECVLLGLASAPLGLAIAYVGVWLLDGAVPPDDMPYYIHWEISAARHRLHDRHLGADRTGLRPRAGAAGRPPEPPGSAERRRARLGTERPPRARCATAWSMLEVALSLVLLVGASLFVRSFLNLQSASPGFDTAPLLTLRFFMTGDALRDRRAEGAARRRHRAPHRSAARRAVSAFASNFVPLDAGGGGGNAIVDGRAVPKGEEPTIRFTAVTPHLYKTMGLPLLKGRDFTDAEGAEPHAGRGDQRHHGEEAVAGCRSGGRRFRLVETEPAEWFTVIGVAPDIQQYHMDDDKPPMPMAYVPYRFGRSRTSASTIRAAGDPAGLTAARPHRDPRL